MVSLINAGQLTLDKVIIHAIEDNTFRAVLKLNAANGTTHELDARPSDAIAIALRLDAPIWVMEEVVAEASMPVDRDADEAEKQAFQAFLANLSPSDFIQRGGRSSTSNDAFDS
jgi:hypothetical protein